jgi:spore coat polysaccharide biosynthesis protein SpsF (cytidylyltransferase family)/spore coat polysaccharide biosynthesis predicted glycosyltransferase SpsG
LSKVLGIIGARLNSSRLPRKHLLDLAGRPVIARIFERLGHIPEFDRLVLATTADDYNSPLSAWAEAAGQAVFAYNGDVNDLVGRVDAVVQAEQPDIVVYICGDSPLIEPATLSALIRELQMHPQADGVELAAPAAGKYIHEGFSVYRRALWQRIVAESRSADDKEHVGSVLKRLRPQLNIRQIEDDPVFASLEHRISVDTPSDYRFMQEIYRRWYAGQPAESIVSLAWVIAQLQQDPALAAINRNVRQKAIGEQSAPLLIVCQAGPGIGLGHLGRCLALARALQDRHFAGIRLLIQAPEVEKSGLQLLPHTFIAPAADLIAACRAELLAKSCRAVIFDLSPERIPTDLADFLGELGEQGVRRIGIDSLRLFAGPGDRLDLLCLPGFYVAPAVLAACHPTPLRQGWPYYLIEISRQSTRHPDGTPPRVLILTGGSDTTGLGAGLPSRLDQALPAGTQVDWVRGPYAAAPAIPENARLSWHLHTAPSSLAPLMEQADYALTIYGVSLFELLGKGVPSVVFSPYGGRDEGEIPALAAADVAVVAPDEATAVSALAQLMGDREASRHLAEQGPRHVDGDGPARLARDIFALLEARP